MRAGREVIPVTSLEVLLPFLHRNLIPTKIRDKRRRGTAIRQMKRIGTKIGSSLKIMMTPNRKEKIRKERKKRG